MDMTPELFRRVEPALTVYSGRPFIDPQVAPREAMMALPTMDDTKVTSLIAARTGQIPNVESSLSLKGHAFTIRAEVERPSGIHGREAVVRLTDNPAQPYWVLSWKLR
jgi:general secretion pathway protein K